MKETMMCPGTRGPLNLACVAVCFAAALVVLVSPVLAEIPVNQTWNEEHGELLGQINRLKKSKKKWRNRLKAEREAVVERDSVLAKKLQKVWGKPKAFMDTPPGDRGSEALR